ncbi:MAG: Fic family protein, partial [Gemmatimonadaceae bacterium]
MPGRHLDRTWTYKPEIHAPTKYKRACKYRAFVPASLSGLNVSLDLSISGVVSEAENAIRELNDVGGHSIGALARLLLRTESIASSRVEGMQLGVRELARAEAKVESGEKTSPTAREVLANIEAMVLAVDEAAAQPKFDISHIIAIHRRLLERSDNKRIAGVLRTGQNWIGGNDYNPCGADFVPPPPEDVPTLLTDLCDAINDDRLSPLVQAALVHAQFETIHPFDDGNGRTGRALIHVVLRRRGLAPRYVPPVSLALAASKDRYIAGLTDFRGDDVGRWIDYFASASASASHRAVAYLGAVTKLCEEWRAKLQQNHPPRKGAAAWALIEVLPAHPILTAAMATAATGRAKAAIYDAISQLERA